MRVTRNWVLLLFSVGFLLTATGFSSFTIAKIASFSLPIPQSLSYTTAVLPAVSGFLFLVGQILDGRGRRQSFPSTLGYPNQHRVHASLSSVVVVLLISTVILTLLGTYAAPIQAVPGSADCSLQMQWSALFKDKNTAAIRTVQDTFSCCGFRTSADMAWPFPDGKNRADACETMFGRTTSCLQFWREEGRKLAGFLMLSVALTVIWLIIIFIVTGGNRSRIHRILPSREWNANFDGDVDEDTTSGADRSRQRTDNDLSQAELYSEATEEEPVAVSELNAAVNSTPVAANRLGQHKGHRREAHSRLANNLSLKSSNGEHTRITL